MVGKGRWQEICDEGREAGGGRQEAGGRKEGTGTKMGSVVPTVSTPDRQSMVIKLAAGVGRMGGSKGQWERPASR